MSEGPRYCAYFCEENIWHLCADPGVREAERHALIITNPGRRVAVWGQRLAKDPSLPIAWDYHVVLLYRLPERGWKVWDLDGLREGPRPARSWLDDSFRGQGVIPDAFLPRFRLVASADYRRHLCSDRRHMRAADGTELQPHPPWPPIAGEPVDGAAADEGVHNLDRFLDTEDLSFVGEVFDLDQLRAWLANSGA